MGDVKQSVTAEQQRLMDKGHGRRIYKCGHEESCRCTHGGSLPVQYPQEDCTRCLDKQAGVAEEIVAAEEACEEPKSPEQARAGNYRHGHVTLHGMGITIETAKGMTRRGVDQNGTAWSIKLKNSYGYVKRTTSEADKDHFDVFIGDHPESELVFVVDQYCGGKFDEHKGLIGCLTKEEAKKTYLANYAEGWDGCKSVTSLTLPQFKQWITTGDTSKPLAGQRLKFEQHPLRKALLSYAKAAGFFKENNATR